MEDPELSAMTNKYYQKGPSGTLKRGREDFEQNQILTCTALLKLPRILSKHQVDVTRNLAKGRCFDMEETMFTPCLEAIPHVKSADGDIQTKPFLDACKLVLLVIDKFGAAMALVKADVGGNISRLDAKYEQDPSVNRLIYEIVRKEIE